VRVRLRWACLIILTLSIVGFLLRAELQSAHAQDESPWLVTAASDLEKTIELPSNIPPKSNNVDCDQEVIAMPVPAGPQTVCMFMSPFGQLTIDGRIRLGSTKLVDLHGSEYQSVFLPTTNSSLGIVSIPSSGIGNRLGVYRQLTKADLRLNMAANAGTYYDIQRAPDGLLRDPVSKQPLEVNTDSIAFSSNGDWMVVSMPHRGLLRVHMQDLSTQLFAAPIEPSWYLGLAAPQLAITNDGRYVAANTDIFGAGNLLVYDLSTCSDQIDVVNNQTYCKGKDILHGKTQDGQPMGHGLQESSADLQRPAHIRFINDDTVSFNARYDVGTNGDYKAAIFVATSPGTVRHKLGLLGLGDSYISGQGAFLYRPGTDTANNPCHLSEFSYPFLLGKQYFDSSNSIACSGAKTSDLIGLSDKYIGQVRDKVPESGRDKNPILSNFLPGYLYQQEFAAAYQPEAMLLSVGGDDIGFADIVKQCVANQGGGTCYDTYEDRAELLSEIDRTYPKLVHTYQILREQSGGGRLYVVGYPQVAKPGGDCGLNVHLNAEEVVFSSQLVEYLNDVIRQAADTAGVAYVDVAHAFDGHRLCEASAGQSAMNGFTVGSDAGVIIGNRPINFIGAESYHPTPLGYRLLADVIAHETAGLTTSMPNPKPYTLPAYDPNLPILQTMPRTNRALNQMQYDNTLTDDVLLHGATQHVAMDAISSPLAPGSAYQVVLHSDPIILATSIAAADGSIDTNVVVPGAATPGYHTLHIYGQDIAGTAIDIQKPVYVAATESDYDGNGVPNSGSRCLLFAVSGIDSDRDGVDDACDADITAGPANAKVAAPGSSSMLDNVTFSPTLGILTKQTDQFKAQTAVLGKSIRIEPAQPVAQEQGPHVPKTDLLRVNWPIVLIAGGAITSAITAVCSYISRR
jgi:hypothetical protein